MGRHTLPTREAKRMSAKRKTLSGGRLAGVRKRGAKRCPCGVMTLKRALARADMYGKGLGHDPSCTFYRERAIVVRNCLSG